ncbi:hypothetical protein [Ornithinimicrobium faecis]|uniref:Iron-sulfur cluster repair di-iron protein, ric n=1 Tax=Ornithinimicrobium faecis TaxID=2934158 RepID=A0ABY4YPN1_9MICO|nr:MULTISPECIES: hypothetical protein [unclassified Ornithinimicrobium]USQ78659.1 hypothetical protein NF556_13605 [Ornithinimicrobium sp. HY1793]
MTDLSTAAQLAPILERVHGAHHPELTRIRELTQQIAQSADGAATTILFRELRAITNYYSVPSDGCEAFVVTYGSLRSADMKHSRRDPR